MRIERTTVLDRIRKARGGLPSRVISSQLSVVSFFSMAAFWGALPVFMGCGKEEAKPPAGGDEPSVAVSRPEEPARKEAAAVDTPPPATSPAASPIVITSQPSHAAPPASSPTATRASVPAFMPLTDAARGEWAHYEGLEKRELRYEVVRASETEVTVQVTVFQESKPLGLPILREERRDADPLGQQAGVARAERRASPAKIEVAGRSWNALLYEDRWTDEEVQYVRRTWVSTDAPVFGMLRMELHGDGAIEARLELKALGTR